MSTATRASDALMAGLQKFAPKLHLAEAAAKILASGVIPDPRHQSVKSSSPQSQIQKGSRYRSRTRPMSNGRRAFKNICLSIQLWRAGLLAPDKPRGVGSQPSQTLQCLGGSAIGSVAAKMAHG